MGALPAQIGRYRILRVLGSGGMGIVYEAEDEVLCRRTALKVLHDRYALDPEVTQRFFDEARAASKIKHHGIVQIYEVGLEPPATPYLAMEFLRGQSLAGRLKSADGGRDPRTLLGFMAQVAEALAHAHRSGVVHRDVKPENVFIALDPAAADGERAKLLDFGLAKLFGRAPGSEPTQTGLAMGSPPFMPPEQWLNAKTADGKSDAYSFGVMLFEVLSGRLPFQGRDAVELLDQHLQHEASFLGSLVPDLPAPLLRLVHALLEKQQEQRPPMDVVAQTLREVREVHGATLVAQTAPRCVTPELEATQPDAAPQPEQGTVPRREIDPLAMTAPGRAAPADAGRVAGKAREPGPALPRGDGARVAGTAANPPPSAAEDVARGLPAWLKNPQQVARPNDPWVRARAASLDTVMARAIAETNLRDEEIEDALFASVRLATLTGQDRWLAWTFDFARLCKYPMPLKLLDELYALMFARQPDLGPAIDEYMPFLRDPQALQMLERLRRFCAP